MSKLREDYKNDMFSGMRKYEIVQNEDGTISLNDVTSYSQVGDIFNADDINSTNKAVNDTVEGFETVKQETTQFQQNMTQSFNSLELSTNTSIQNLQNSTNTSLQNLQNNVNAQVGAVKAVKTVTLSASSWSSSAPYTQTKSVSGIEASDTPVVALYISGSPTAATVKAQKKAFGYLDRAVTANGSITFYCYEKKPTVDFSVSVKGE